MSVHFLKGDLFDWTHWNCIAHGCNCKGVQGSGLAKAIRDRYPSAYEDYRQTFETDGLRLGEFVVSKIEEGRRIVHLLVQDDYRREPTDRTRYVSYDALCSSLETLRDSLENAVKEGRGPYSVGVPLLLGADRAGGNWAVNEAIIQSVFAGSAIPLYIVEKS